MKKQLNSSKNSDQIKLPIINGPIAPPSSRSMDEIDAWIEENYRLFFFDRAKYQEEKRKYSVYKVFKLD